MSRKEPHTYFKIWWWMLWGYFSSTGPVALRKVNGIMKFIRTFLPKNLVASARRLELGREWIFQQDNNPTPTSKSTKKWLIGHKNLNFAMGISVSEPIENLWFELMRTVYKRRQRISRIWKDYVWRNDLSSLPNVFSIS